MFTEEQLNEILAVCEKSPLGPWKYEREEQSTGAESGLKLVFETVVDANGVKILRSNDKWLAQFIALARTALPQLAEDYRKLAGYALQVEKALDLLLDNLFEMDDETCPADVDGEHFCCDINICGVERPYKECWLKFYLDKAKAGEDAGYGGEE